MFKVTSSNSKSFNKNDDKLPYPPPPPLPASSTIPAVIEPWEILVLFLPLLFLFPFAKMKIITRSRRTPCTFFCKWDSRGII